MSGDMTQQKNLQSLSTEEFFYFFLRLRKGEVRRTVSTLSLIHISEPTRLQ